MKKEEYISNMRAMVKKYVVREEDSVTNPPTKRVEMPRAKLNDLLITRTYTGDVSQMGVEKATINERGIWEYKCFGNDRPWIDDEILINLSTGIDYQETESKPTCLHRWKIIGQLPNITGEECELCGRIIGTR